MSSNLIFKSIFTGNHVFTSLQPLVSKSEAVVPRKRKKNSRRCLDSGGKEPVWESHPPVALQWICAPHVGKHWALSSARFTVHCWRMQNRDMSLFVTFMIWGVFHHRTASVQETDYSRVHVKWFTMSFPQTHRNYKGFYMLKLSFFSNQLSCILCSICLLLVIVFLGSLFQSFRGFFSVSTQSE